MEIELANKVAIESGNRVVAILSLKQELQTRNLMAQLVKQFLNSINSNFSNKCFKDSNFSNK